MKKEYIVELREEEADELMDEHWVGELVRCKDCYFGEHTINGAGERCVQCTNSDLGMMGDCHTPNWYCADGERRKN